MPAMYDCTRSDRVLAKSSKRPHPERRRVDVPCSHRARPHPVRFATRQTVPLRAYGSSERDVEDHHRDEAEHKALHREGLVAVGLHLRHLRAAQRRALAAVEASRSAAEGRVSPRTSESHTTNIIAPAASDIV